MSVSRLLALFSRLFNKVVDVSLPKNPRIKATHFAILVVGVPRNGVPKKTTPTVDFKRFAYFVESREALAIACDYAHYQKESNGLTRSDTIKAGSPT